MTTNERNKIMDKFEVSGTIFKEVKEIIEAKNETEACKVFFTLFGIYPDIINDKGVLGVCESCSDIIFEDSKYGSDEEGTYLCEKCCNDCLQHIGDI